MTKKQIKLSGSMLSSKSTLKRGYSLHNNPELGNEEKQQGEIVKPNKWTITIYEMHGKRKIENNIY